MIILSFVPKQSLVAAVGYPKGINCLRMRRFTNGLWKLEIRTAIAMWHSTEKQPLKLNIHATSTKFFAAGVISSEINYAKNPVVRWRGVWILQCQIWLAAQHYTMLNCMHCISCWLKPYYLIDDNYNYALTAFSGEASHIMRQGYYLHHAMLVTMLI